VCCVFSGRGLCDMLMTCGETSYRVSACLCDQMERSGMEPSNNTCYLHGPLNVYLNPLCNYILERNSNQFCISISEIIAETIILISYLNKNITGKLLIQISRIIQQRRELESSLH
jgi:hypothetical protein